MDKLKSYARQTPNDVLQSLHPHSVCNATHMHRGSANAALAPGAAVAGTRGTMTNGHVAHRGRFCRATSGCRP